MGNTLHAPRSSDIAHSITPLQLGLELRSAPNISGPQINLRTCDSPIKLGFWEVYTSRCLGLEPSQFKRKSSTDLQTTH